MGLADSRNRESGVRMGKVGATDCIVRVRVGYRLEMLITPGEGVGAGVTLTLIVTRVPSLPADSNSDSAHNPSHNPSPKPTPAPSTAPRGACNKDWTDSRLCRWWRRWV